MFEVTLFDEEGREIGTHDALIPVPGQTLEYGDYVTEVLINFRDKTVFVWVEY